MPVTRTVDGRTYTRTEPETPGGPRVWALAPAEGEEVVRFKAAPADGPAELFDCPEPFGEQPAKNLYLRLRGWAWADVAVTELEPGE